MIVTKFQHTDQCSIKSLSKNNLDFYQRSAHSNLFNKPIDNLQLLNFGINLRFFEKYFSYSPGGSQLFLMQ